MCQEVCELKKVPYPGCKEIWNRKGRATVSGQLKCVISEWESLRYCQLCGLRPDCSAAPTAVDSAQMGEWSSFPPIKLYLWTSKLEFYKTSTEQKYHYFDFTYLFALAHHLLPGPTKLVVGCIWARGPALQTLCWDPRQNEYVAAHSEPMSCCPKSFWPFKLSSVSIRGLRWGERDCTSIVQALHCLPTSGMLGRLPARPQVRHVHPVPWSCLLGVKCSDLGTKDLLFCSRIRPHSGNLSASSFSLSKLVHLRLSISLVFSLPGTGYRGRKELTCSGTFWF